MNECEKRDSTEENTDTATDRTCDNNKVSKNGNEQTVTEVDDNAKSPSRWKVYRAMKRDLKSLTNTPMKKAAIVRSTYVLVESPKTANIQYEKGICIAGESKKKT